MNCTAEKQLSHGVFESFEIRKDSFFTVPQCEDTAPIQIGEILNNTYLITRFIAQGGMGIVYEGIDLVLHRKVAIKVLVTDFDDEEYEKELKLFQTEINLCGNLRHPNVIQIYYSGIHHRLPYLVMEYIEGIPINEYVMKQRRFNWNQKVKLISQVAKGLAYIHKNNILHRDIKPSNILVKADGTPVLIDFGISIKKNLATVATNEGELSGTIHYMSPEQVAGECDQIDERSDIYSLGLILYEILIKRPAYTGSPNEIIGQIFNSSLLPPSDVNINISETLSNITMKAIAKEPEDRYSTATEFIEDLRLYLKNGNNQRVVKTVSLFEKVSYYLKPNPKIAVALGFIVCFFIVIFVIDVLTDGSIKKSIGSITNSIKDMSEKVYRGIRLALFEPNDKPIQFKPISDNENDIVKQEPDEDDPEPPRPPYPPEEDPVIPKSTEEKQKTNTSNQIAQSTQPIENIQTTLPDDKQLKEQNKGIVTINPQKKIDTTEQTKKPEKPKVVPLRWIDIKAQRDRYSLLEPTNWESINYNIKSPEETPIEPGNFIRYILLDNNLYKVTANENELTLINVDFSPIDVYYDQRLLCLNESIICLVYTTSGIIDHLDKIDLNNKITYSYSLSNTDSDNINFDNGQFFTIEDTCYFLSYENQDLYQLTLQEPESDTNNGTITVIPLQKPSEESKNTETDIPPLKYSPIPNTPIVVLNDTLYYFGCNLGWSGLCAVKVSDSQVKSQTRIRSITDTEQNNSLLVTDNINRIWIINNNSTDGVIEYNTRKKISQKILNAIDSYPVFYSSDSAVSFYSNGYLYCIVGQQAYMLYVGVSTEEKIVANGFTQKDATSSELYDCFKYKNEDKFIWVDDSIQIKLNKQNDDNNVFSGVTIKNRKLRKNWKENVLPVQNDLAVIGIIYKEDFRNYYKTLITDFGYNQKNNADSCSVLISEKYYSLEDLKDKELERYEPLDIQYKDQTISVPCLLFWCIVKLDSNKKVQNQNEEVQNVSEWKWREDYKSFRPDDKSFSQQEIAQFNYLDKQGCGITKGFRLMYIIPNE